MELIERIEQIIKSEQISVSGFEKKISASDGVIRRAIRNKTDIYSRFLVALADNFPDISAEWLLRESGNMYRQNAKIDHNEPTNSDALRMIADLAQQVGQLKAENDMLKKEIAHLERVASAAPATAASA